MQRSILLLAVLAAWLLISPAAYGNFEASLVARFPVNIAGGRAQAERDVEADFRFWEYGKGFKARCDTLDGVVWTCRMTFRLGATRCRTIAVSTPDEVIEDMTDRHCAAAVGYRGRR